MSQHGIGLNRMETAPKEPPPGAGSAELACSTEPALGSAQDMHFRTADLCTGQRCMLRFGESFPTGLASREQPGGREGGGGAGGEAKLMEIWKKIHQHLLSEPESQLSKLLNPGDNAAI